MTTAPLTDRPVTVFGGSGFLGRYVVRALARKGYRIRVAVRRPELTGHLKPLGAVGQIHAVQANVRDEGSVNRAATGSRGVINLVGVLAESGKQTFAAVQADGARNIARAAKKAGIEALVHVSAIGADKTSPSRYARTKAAGEQAMRDAVILRPSIMFGQEDEFFNRFANMARFSPVLPLVGGTTRFQPVYVGDVARAVVAALEGGAKKGAPYELGGPDIDTFAGLMRMMLEMIGRKRLIVDLPLPLARMMAAFVQYLPGAPLTLDQVHQLARDNVVSPEAIKAKRTLEGLGIAPRAMEIILPTYLYRYRRAGQFSAEHN